MKTKFKLLLLVLLIFVLPLIANAEGRSISKAYTFSPNGTLKIPLVVDFTKESKTPISAIVQPLSNDKKILSIEIKHGTDDFLLKLDDSLGYVLYKEKTRTTEQEELIVLGFTELAPNRYQLEEIKIVGMDKKGKLASLKLDGFKQMELIRAPLQKTKNGELILALSAYRSGKTTLRIAWQEKSFGYKCLIK